MPRDARDVHRITYYNLVCPDRYANIIPNGVQHVCMRDFTVNGVTIPANTLIQPQMTEILKVVPWQILKNII